MKATEKCVGAVVILVVLATICGRALSEEEGEQAPAASSTPAVRTVVVVEGDAPVKVKVGDIVRVVGSGPSGVVDISAKTEGSLKMVGTNAVREVVNGHNKIGAVIREFEAKATRQGQAKIIVTIDNRLQKKADTREFNIVVE
jgi:hypothetical protein